MSTKHSAPDLCALICKNERDSLSVLYVSVWRHVHVAHLLEILGLARDGSCVGRIVNDYEPLFFRSSALATLAALTKGASVASGSAVCMKAC
jgi:hypothetical protein